MDIVVFLPKAGWWKSFRKKEERELGSNAGINKTTMRTGVSLFAARGVYSKKVKLTNYSKLP